MNYLQLQFHPLTKEQQEMLIAQLSDLGFEGFEEVMNTLVAFIPEANYDAAAVKELLPGENVQVTTTVIPPKNWNEEWEKNFDPVTIGQYAAIRAHFHAPIITVQHEIVITPKMSFGTGHHATTYMMIDYMQELDNEGKLSGKKILDFGTGTGVLAILAEKAGATSVTALDNDDWSIENAAENIQKNQCTKIVLQKADALHLRQQFDVILANINKNVLLLNMAEIRQHLQEDGVVLMSGLLEGDRVDIEAAAQKHGLVIKSEKKQNSWISLRMETELK